MGFHCGWIEVHAVDHCNNTCASCNNSSPFAPKQEYRAEDYIPWLDFLVQKGIMFHKISIMGGEPFLHSNLIEFCSQLHDRFPDKKMILSTNGYWLSEEKIAAYAPLWRMMYSVALSFYPNILKKIGGEERAFALTAMLKDYSPDIILLTQAKTTFSRLLFFHEPREIDKFCDHSDCIALMPDGRMARCGVGAFAKWNPHATDQFRNAAHMFYNLRDFNWNSFWLWRNRYPLDACHYCGLVQGEIAAWCKEENLVQLRKSSRQIVTTENP